MVKKSVHLFLKNQTFKNTLLQENWLQIGKIGNCIQKRHLAIFTNIFPFDFQGRDLHSVQSIFHLFGAAAKVQNTAAAGGFVLNEQVHHALEIQLIYDPQKCEERCSCFCLTGLNGVDEGQVANLLCVYGKSKFCNVVCGFSF